MSIVNEINQITAILKPLSDYLYSQKDYLNSQYFVGDFKSFPKGSCDLVSNIVGYVLEQKGYKNIEVIRGCNIHGKHVWVVVNKEIYIDLTIGQFASQSQKLYIDKKNYFYASFEKNILYRIAFDERKKSLEDNESPDEADKFICYVLNNYQKSAQPQKKALDTP